MVVSAFVRSALSLGGDPGVGLGGCTSGTSVDRISVSISMGVVMVSV